MDQLTPGDPADVRQSTVFILLLKSTVLLLGDCLVFLDCSSDSKD